MKFFTSYLSHETNSYSPLPTSLRNYAETALYLPDRVDGADREKMIARIESASGVGDFIRIAREQGHEVTIGPAAVAQPGGVGVRRDYELIRDAIVAAAKAARPDAVLLMLHGAQIAEGYDDCEGDLLAHLRAMLGPKTPIGVLLDLHGTLSRQMLEAADVMIFCKEYPHTDYPERAAELFDIIERTAKGEIRPATARIRVPFLGGLHTPREPARSLVDHSIALEGHDGVLSTSLIHGFGLSDTADTSANVLVVTEGDRAKAETIARDLAGRFYALRDSVSSEELSIEDAIDKAVAAPAGPVILAEPLDNPGGGWPSDNTSMLAALLAADVKNACHALFWDPIAVQFCFDAGVGARLRLRLGGKTGRGSGAPLDVEAEIIALAEDARQRSIFTQQPAPFGPAAAIRVGGVDIILNSKRSQPFSPDVFTALGVDPSTKQIIALKSSQHFYAMFAPLAAQVLYCNGASGSYAGPRQRGYAKLITPTWPMQDPKFDAASAEVEFYA